MLCEAHRFPINICPRFCFYVSTVLIMFFDDIRILTTTIIFYKERCQFFFMLIAYSSTDSMEI